MNNLYSPTENIYQPDKPINAVLQELQDQDQYYKIYQFQVTVFFRFTLKGILSHAL